SPFPALPFSGPFPASNCLALHPSQLERHLVAVLHPLLADHAALDVVPEIVRLGTEHAAARAVQRLPGGGDFRTTQDLQVAADFLTVVAAEQGHGGVVVRGRRQLPEAVDPDVGGAGVLLAVDLDMHATVYGRGNQAVLPAAVVTGALQPLQAAVL